MLRLTTKDILRPEAAAVALALALLAAGAFLFQERADTRTEAEDINGQVAATRATIAALQEEGAKMDSRVVRAALDSEPLPLPSAGEALGLSSRLTAYFTEAGLQVGAYSTGRESADLAGSRYPAIGFAISATGVARGLMGVLEVVQEMPTAFVRNLDFERHPDLSDQWVMTLDLVVVFGEG